MWVRGLEVLSCTTQLDGLVRSVDTCRHRNYDRVSSMLVWVPRSDQVTPGALNFIVRSVRAHSEDLVRIGHWRVSLPRPASVDEVDDLVFRLAAVQASDDEAHSLERIRHPGGERSAAHVGVDPWSR